MAAAAPRVTGPPSGEDVVALHANEPPGGDPLVPGVELELATEAADWSGVP
jgi:hypothetical protein